MNPIRLSKCNRQCIISVQRTSSSCLYRQSFATNKKDTYKLKAIPSFCKQDRAIDLDRLWQCSAYGNFLTRKQTINFMKLCRFYPFICCFMNHTLATVQCRHCQTQRRIIVFTADCCCQRESWCGEDSQPARKYPHNFALWLCFQLCCKSFWYSLLCN